MARSGARAVARLAAAPLAALALAACTGAPTAAPSPATPVAGSGPAAPGGHAPVAASTSPPGVAPPAAAVPGATGTGRPAGTPGAGTPSASPATARVRLRTLARLTLTGQTYGRGLVLWGRYAAWLGCSRCERSFAVPTTLYVADVSRGRVRVVATAPRDGTVVPLGGAGSSLVYALVTPGPGTSAQWQLRVLDLHAGRSRTLAAQRQGADAVTPVAVVGDSRVAWQTHDAGRPGNGPVWAADLPGGAVQRLTRDLAGQIVAVNRAGLFYRAALPPGTLDRGPTDLWLLPGGRARARVLSATHDVRWAVADRSTGAWETDGTAAGVWAVAPAGRGAPRRYHQGPTGDRAVGSGFLAVVTSDDLPVLLVYPLAGGPVAAVGDVPEQFDGMAADGARLAWFALPGDRGEQPDARRPLRLVVAAVDTTRPSAASTGSSAP